MTKNKKIIISVLAGGDENYSKKEDAARATCFKNPPDNISIYYVYNKKEGIAIENGQTTLIDDCFYYGAPEKVRWILRKCVEFWGYCLENFEFDYIFRPNLGCWVSMDTLNKLVGELPSEGVYGGAFGTSGEGIPFISGSGFLLSRDLVELIWDYHLNNKDITIEYDGNNLLDDVAIGAFLAAKKVKRTKLPRIDLHEAQISSSKIDLDCHHYYFIDYPKSPNCYYLMNQAIKEGISKKKSIGDSDDGQ